MSNPNSPDSQPVPETTESFNDALSEFEREHRRQPQTQMEGTVISVTPESVILDFGYKTEGTLPLSDFVNEQVKPGDKIPVTVKGRDPEGGFYLLSRFKVARPTDWSAATGPLHLRQLHRYPGVDTTLGHLTGGAIFTLRRRKGWEWRL